MTDLTNKQALKTIKQMAEGCTDETQKAALTAAIQALSGETCHKTIPEEEPEDGLLHEYTVRILTSELTIHAYSKERANEIAQEISESDARTQLNYGYTIEDYETCYEGTSDEEEETNPNP